MIPVVSRAQARAFDERAVRRSVPSLLLMENAGRGVVDAIARRWPVGPRSIPRAHAVVVCGVGNNGGDGFVVARHLVIRGASVEVFVAGALASVAGDARIELDALCGVGVAPREVDRDLTRLSASLANASFVVDALFGTGLSRPIEGGLAAVVEAMQHAHRPIVAVDLPSGLDADTGAALGTAIRAELTVTFGALKLGLVTPRGAALAGDIVVADIGVPGPSADGEHDGASDVGPSARLLEGRDASALLAPRSVGTHKNAAGHVVIFAGSAGHVGAAVMCAHGALRAGAGLATVATWPDAADQLDARVVEVMTARLDPDAIGRSVDAALARATVVVMGPGFGKDEAARAVVRHVLREWQGPSVVDADALAMFGGDAEVFAASKGAAVLTPHPGELGVLLGTSAAEVEADRFAAVAECVSRARSVTLLKGAHTIIGAPDERPVVNGSGTPALATAGSGDILAGTIGALACALDPFEAAFVGAHLHGLAAEAWTAARGDRGLLAHEIADEYPRLVARLIAEGRGASAV